MAKLDISSLFFDDYWYIKYRKKEANKLFDDSAEWNYLKPPKDRYWADPFVISKNGVHYFFVEEFIYQQHHGNIKVIVLENNKIIDQRVILNLDVHISFPCVFEHNEELYMIPETGLKKRIELYRCVTFPFVWEKECNIRENSFSFDTIISRHIDHWWLFTMDVTNAGPVLNLYYADELNAKLWHKHPNNPITGDIKSLRSAGSLIKLNNKTLRPAQDSGRRYGYSISIQEIIKWNFDEYQENTWRRLEPRKNEIAQHTINTSSDLIVMDAAVSKVRSARNILGKIKHKILHQS